MEASRAAVSAPRAVNARPLPKLRPSAERTFERLYKKHARDVYQYALALLANPADAEDVTQTTFLNAYRALQRGDRPHRPHNWLIAIAHNVCRMRWRQACHRPREVALEDAPEPVAPDRDGQPSIDDVLRALSRLSFNQRSALVMRELEGRSCKEIAEVLGLSVSAVEALLFRARRRLQIERKALGVLGTAPLPGKLASALGIGGGGGGAATTGGLAVLGGDALLKAATALVVVGAAASGAVAIARPTPTYHPVKPTAAIQSKSAHKATATHARAKPASTQLREQPGTLGARPATAGTAPNTGGTTSSGGTGPLPQPPAITAPPGVSVPQVPVQTPAVQTPPVQLPVLPVQLPTLPPVPPLPPLPPLQLP